MTNVSKNLKRKWNYYLSKKLVSNIKAFYFDTINVNSFVIIY